MLFKVKNIHGNKIMLFNLFINCYLFHARFKTSQTPEIRILIAIFWPYLHLLIQNETPYGHYRTRNNIAGKWNTYDSCRPKIWGFIMAAHLYGGLQIRRYGLVDIVTENVRRWQHHTRIANHHGHRGYTHTRLTLNISHLNCGWTLH